VVHGPAIDHDVQDGMTSVTEQTVSYLKSLEQLEVDIPMTGERPGNDQNPWKESQHEETRLENSSAGRGGAADAHQGAARDSGRIEETRLENPGSEQSDSASGQTSVPETADEHSVTMWISSLQSGDQDASAKVWQRFYMDLVGRVSRRMQSSPVRDADADDVVQEAFHSFFKRAEDGQFPDLNDRHDLWKLLVTLTERKALNQIRGALAKKRGGGDLQGESIFLQAAEGDQGAGIDRVAGTEITPEDAALVEESFGNLIELLDPEQRLIAVYKLEGRTNEEIAKLLDCAVATIERRLNLIRRKWSESATAIR